MAGKEEEKGSAAHPQEHARVRLGAHHGHGHRDGRHMDGTRSLPLVGGNDRCSRSGRRRRPGRIGCAEDSSRYPSRREDDHRHRPLSPGARERSLVTARNLPAWQHPLLVARNDSLGLRVRTTLPPRVAPPAGMMAGHRSAAWLGWQTDVAGKVWPTRNPKLQVPIHKGIQRHANDRGDRPRKGWGATTVSERSHDPGRPDLFESAQELTEATASVFAAEGTVKRASRDTCRLVPLSR